MSTAPVALGERGSGPSVAWSILLIILGLLAIASPLAASLGVVIVIGWLLLFDGVTQVVHAFQSKGAGHISGPVGFAGLANKAALTSPVLKAKRRSSPEGTNRLSALAGRSIVRKPKFRAICR
jgi:hypothetical protein